MCFFGVAFFNVACVSTQSWPKDIPSKLINDYTKNKTYISNADLYCEYLHVLQYINNAVIAIKENLNNNVGKNNNFIIKYPMLIDGNLVICEKESSRLVWDQELFSYRKEIEVEVPLEIVNLSVMIKTYNNLIDYWYKKTGYILKEKYDEASEATNINRYIVELFNEY